jgi:hypothetical protein
LVYPPDFERDYLRAGVTAEDLYRSIAAGLTGTAMPTWIDSMHLPSPKAGAPPLVRPDDLWATAYYVQSLVARRPAKLTEGEFAVRERPQWISLTGQPPPAAPKPEAAPAQEFIEEE